MHVRVINSYRVCDCQTLFVVCLSRASILHVYWWTKSDASYKFKGEGRGKNSGSTIEYMKLGQLIIRKITKIIATICHILRLY